MPHKTYPIERGQRSIQSDARSLKWMTDCLSNKEDGPLIVAVQEIELECYRLAKECADFATMLNRLPKCPLCSHANDTDHNPHEDCVEEAKEEAERLGTPLPAA
jgi:hypothetical protein